jgi:drug/metabolite transporter (DMT)-like permease
MHHLAFIFVCLVWSASFIFMKKAAVMLGPISIAGWRVFGGALVLVLLWRTLRRATPWSLRWTDALPLLGLVLVGDVYTFILQPYLIHQLNDSAFIGVMVALVPLLTIVISLPLLKVRPTRRQVTGVVGGLGFMFLLLGEGLRRDMTWLQLALAVSVPLGYAIRNVYLRRRFADQQLLTLTIAELTLAAIIMLPIGLAGEPVREVDTEAAAWAIACLAALAVVGTGLANFLFNWLIRQRGPLYAGMVTYLIPLGALLWGGLDDEPITAPQVIAVVGIIAMVVLVQATPMKPDTE